jgi:hypothetical protein
MWVKFDWDRSLGRVSFRILICWKCGGKGTRNYDSIVVYRPVARQRPRKEQLYNSCCWETASQTSIFARQRLETVTGTVFSMRSVPRCYKQDSWSNELFDWRGERVARVEAGLNTSTVALLVIGGDEKGTQCPGNNNWPPCSWGILIRGPGPPGWGSLESETVKCGHESRGTRTWEWLLWRGPVAIVNDRPIPSSERMLDVDDDCKC